MAIITSLAACSTNPALNGPDGATDLPSSLDDAIRYALAFIAQLRDGVATGGGQLWMTGMMSQFPAITSPPPGWLKLNGALVSRTTYANLFAYASLTGLVSEATWAADNWGRFSVGDGSTTFRLPDMRGVFPRGLSDGASHDAGRVVGTFQADALLVHNHGVNDFPHTHTASTDAQGIHNHGLNDPGHFHLYGINNVNAPGGGSGAPSLGGNTIPTSTSGTGISIQNSVAHSHNVTINSAPTGISIQSFGIGENRVRNMAHMYFIKY